MHDYSGLGSVDGVMSRESPFGLTVTTPFVRGVPLLEVHSLTGENRNGTVSRSSSLDVSTYPLTTTKLNCQSLNLLYPEPSNHFSFRPSLLISYSKFLSVSGTSTTAPYTYK